MTTKDTTPEDELEAKAGFEELGLAPEVLAALNEIGYETPSSIQAQTIPHILEGRDLVGQAQTGTGKTAAFALPLLSRLDLEKRDTQVLVLVPTRELSIQVSEAFTRYAAQMPGFHVIPIYGGQGYGIQLKQLRRGVHVIVATPGRLTDHLKRGTLTLDALDCLVIDEADEMLRMGFIEEVEWILQQTPSTRQVALFSATMPPPIRKIANSYLRDPIEVTIKEKTATASTIRQRYWMVSGLHKLDALTRIMESEPMDAAIVFVRTRGATNDLAARLEARGFAAAPLSGDISQNQREQTVEKLRNGDIDVIVATDVAARGLDVQRISHVINYDIPHDTEAYIHRIGRTGRAGRSGEAILFVSPRERRLLLLIEKATRQKIELMDLPSAETINDIRITKFKQRIADTLAVEELGFFYQIVEQFRQEHNIPAIEIAAALAKMVSGDAALTLSTDPTPKDTREYFTHPSEERPRREPPARIRERQQNPFEDAEDEPEEKPYRARPERSERTERPRAERAERPARGSREVQEGFERYRIDVGNNHGVKTGQIVGAIANEGGLEGSNIGRIDIRDDYALVDLPEGMPREILMDLKKTVVCGRPLRIARMDPASDSGPTEKRSYSKPSGDFKPKREYKPKGDFSSRDDFKPKRDYKSKGEYKSKGDYKSDKPKGAGFKSDKPKFGGFKSAGPKKEGFKSAGPKKEGYKSAGPKKEGFKFSKAKPGAFKAKPAGPKKFDKAAKGKKKRAEYDD